jgi:outer membrane protein TolC
MGSGKTEKIETTTGNASMPGMNMAGNPSPGNTGSGSMEGMNMGGGALSGMSEVLRIQLEIIEIESNIEGVVSELKAGKARFNALLNRPAESEVAVPDTFTQRVYLFDPDAALLSLGEQNPMLGMIREETLAYKAQWEMNKKMAYPMFGIGLQYMWIGKTPESAAGATDDSHNSMNASSPESTMSSMNGKDMIMPMLSVSIPIFRGKYKAAQKESQLLRQASEEKYFNTQNLLVTSLYQFKHQLDDAQRKIELYRKQSELARITYDLVVKEFAAGKSDLSAVIQVQRQLLDYQLKEAEATAAYNTAVANIQKITADGNDDV